jgi:uncharacterized membrane protein YhiD involved in acid resistance
MNITTNLLQTDLSLSQVILSFLVAFGLAFLWATIYRKTHSGLAYMRSFYLTLIVISPAVAMVMMAIGSNVALSLGLVGALSIIRFRNVIKDTRDMLFLFVSVAIGLAAGADVWDIAVAGTIVVSIIVLVFWKLGHSAPGSADYILIFRSDQKEPWTAVSPETQQLVSWKQLRGATDLDSGTDFEYTYSVRLAPKASPESVLSGLADGNGHIRQVQLIAPENHLAI